MASETTRIGKNGMLFIPASLRMKYGLRDGVAVVAEEREDGIFIRTASLSEVEKYTPERVAEFLLSNAIDEADYEEALIEVRGMGLDPAKITHVAPSGKSK